MKKIIVYGLATCCGVCNAFAAEDSLLNPKAVAEVLGKYSAQINQNFQTKIMSNCVSGYLNQDVLDLEHFLHCCKSTIGRDFTNMPTCNKMGQDMRAAHNKYQEADANNIPEIGKTCDPIFDKQQTGVLCPNGIDPMADLCTATCNSGYRKWNFKIETCQHGYKVAPNGLVCMIDPTAKPEETPYRGKACVSGEDKPIRNVKCPSDWGATTSCDVECIGGMWTYSINGCKEGSHIDKNGSGICLAGDDEEYGNERKFHAPCTKQDLPNGATSGWYIKSNKEADGLTCAAKTCDSKHYLVRNAKGVSMGWCKYGKDPEIVKQEEAEELARLKAENAGLEPLKPEISGVDVKPISTADVKLPGSENQADEPTEREKIERLTPDISGIDVKPVSAADVKIQAPKTSDEFEVVIKNCKQSDLNALHATAGTERSDGCYVQKCVSGYHLELNGKRITLNDDSNLNKNIKCVKDVVLPTAGASCPDSRFKDAKHQLPANASAGKFVKQGSGFVCSATACSGSDYEVVTENGVGVCKKKIAKLSNPVPVLQNDSTYVAPTYIKPETQNMPQQQNYLYFNPNVPAPTGPQAFFKQG